ncbi:Crp/Fnr family transcriptional regulator [Rhodoplanes sp. Z2-YC6860]|uniref:Crp/Fnr family transcriptional regulator n=1 Tax=Rhodoplanes sp. Z2-YC6860 TaxID=674703 RepID=UPI00078BE9DD|nr:Crp/Fnr family transcriptional regulator [Rhodoplanes sp. Z2-YC6860]AMN43731.1 Crp/Fnr family transcriptional regulator [Rhodoplanes sp. Z2-YC6860]
MLSGKPQAKSNSTLPEALLDFLFVAATTRALKNGELLFSVGDAGDGCYLIQNGLLKVFVTSQSGEDRIVAILGAGDVVGELSMIDGLPRSASVVAITDCNLQFISRDTFLETASRDSEIQNALIRMLSTRLREAVKSMAASSFLTVKGRVARALLDLAKHIGIDSNGAMLLDYKINQGDLAAIAGVARENVSRALGEFQRRKILTRKRDRYVISNVAALKRETDYGG